MRLWSLHPKYLDSKGLVALWREGLLAQDVLAGKTKGYKHHPQLARFLDSSRPEGYIAVYLRSVFDEAMKRGYNFDGRKIRVDCDSGKISVTDGQLAYEWVHLMAKLRSRAPQVAKKFEHVDQPDQHPMFDVVKGVVAKWEVVKAVAANSFLLS